MQKQKSRQEVLTEITDTQDAKIASFESDQDAFHANMHPAADSREQEARRIDTNFSDKMIHQTNKRFEFAVPNWNDGVSDADMWDRCNEIRETLTPIAEHEPSHAHFLRGIRHLLDNSFSESIKQHIVSLTASRETVEGACKDCFGLYDREPVEIDTAMLVWHTLSGMLHMATVYDAFLERAWHLNPASQYFPSRYKDFVKAVRLKESDKRLRKSVYYADPYNQMQELNETAKQIKFALRHTTDPKEIAKLSSAQVKVLGALWVINERLDSQHQRMLSGTKQQASLSLSEN